MTNTDFTTPEPALTNPRNSEIPDMRGFLWAGVVIAVLGLLALIFPFISTIAVTLIIGISFVAAGLVKVWRAFASGPDWLKAAWSLIYLGGGGLILYAPLAGAWSLTVILAALFIIGGLVSVAWALARPRLPGWGWMTASGVVSVALGVLVGFAMPVAALWLPGVVAGVDLLTTGVAFIAMDRAGAALRAR